MGFASQSNGTFLAFVATVVPGVFVMGVLTVLRITDISIEHASAEMSIARVHKKYRALGTEAEAFFQPKSGRWPEGPATWRCA